MEIYSSLDLMCNMRIGIAKDIHKLKRNAKLILGGVEIPYKKGLVSHTDGDVVLHSLIDAIFGALNKGDIGTNFPPSDDTYKDMSSLELLEKTQKIVEICRVSIENIDIFISCEEPKLAGYIPKMKENIGSILGVSIDRISIKAGTNEGLGYIGKKKAIESSAAVLSNEGDK